MSSKSEIDKSRNSKITLRQERLVKYSKALGWVVKVKGLKRETIDRFYIGLADRILVRDDSFCSKALAAPVLGRDGNPLRHWVYHIIPNISINPEPDESWASSAPLAYYSENVRGKKRIFVCDRVDDVWRLFQEANGNDDFLFVSSTHRSVIAEEFCKPEFWKDFVEVYIAFTGGEDGDRRANKLKEFCPAVVKRVNLPEKFASWNDFFNAGEIFEDLIELISAATVMPDFVIPKKNISNDELSLGEFAVDAVNCNGAFVNGHLYYPYRVEKRQIEREKRRDGTIREAVVTSYLIKVVRSDGIVLDIGYLPAPRGTPASERVLALSDGTRIEQMPPTNLHATWYLDSINYYICQRQAGKEVMKRSFRNILVDVENHFRCTVWLPFDEDYAVAALYTAMSFIYNVFDAIPLLLVSGEKGTGKTELGLAFEAVSFNACIIGQSSAASAVRIMNKSRGLIIWDDLESVAARRDKSVFGDVHQMLKLSYKKKTSRKTITIRNGDTTTFDFYGPKVINNTRGVDQVLRSRMLTVRTALMPTERRRHLNLTGSDPETLFALRNELHVWGMAAASDVRAAYQKVMREEHGSRQDEILAPLKAIAGLTGDDHFLNHLESACRRESDAEQVPLDPHKLLEEALRKVISAGFVHEMSLPHLQLQIAKLVNISPRRMVSMPSAFWKDPQWIGNSISAFKENNNAMRRARLYGKITRIYLLSKSYVKDVIESLTAEERASPVKIKDPFDFCLPRRCADCEFVNICEETVPDLMRGKRNF